MWTRKRTVIGGQTKDGDWTILRHKQPVGRLLPSPVIQGVQPWQWSTLTYPGAHGRADTMEQALEALRTAIRARWPDSVLEVPLAGTKH